MTINGDRLRPQRHRDPSAVYTAVDSATAVTHPRVLVRHSFMRDSTANTWALFTDIDFAPIRAWSSKVHLSSTGAKAFPALPRSDSLSARQ
jgi:hypothetical protein